MKKIAIILALGIGLVLLTQRNSFSLIGSDISSGVGARALGMGGAFVAVAEGIDSCFWNPAGLGNIKNSEVTMMRTMNNRDMANYQEWLSAGTKMGDYGGIGVSYLRVKDRFMWFEKSPERFATSTYGFDDEQIGLSVGGYGSGPLKNVAMGINIRKKSSSLLVGTFTNEVRWSQAKPRGDIADWVEYDWGILYHLNQECSLGLIIQNFSEAEISYGEDAPIYDFPFARRILKGGIAWRPDKKTILAIDINDWSWHNVYDEKLDMGQSSLRVGFERWYEDKMAIRAGLLSKNYHAIGIGVRGEFKKLFKDVKYDLDYALLQGGGMGTHFLSCTLKF